MTCRFKLFSLISERESHMKSIIFEAAFNALKKFTNAMLTIQAISFASVNREELYDYMVKNREETILLSLTGYCILFAISYIQGEWEMKMSAQAREDARKAD